MPWALLIGGSLPDLLHTGSPCPGKGGGSQATPMHASSPSLEMGTGAVPIKFWTSAGKGSVHATPHPWHTEMNCPVPRIMGPLSQQKRNKVQSVGAAWSFFHLAQGSLWKKQGKIIDLLGLKKWPADRGLFFFYFPLSYSMVIRNIIIKQQV